MARIKAQIIPSTVAGLPMHDGRTPLFDAEAIARANQTLQAMSGSFQQWLEADIRKLQNARIEAARARWSDAALEQLFGVAHDIKGMGASYGYPLASQIAASLCRLVETPAGKAAVRADPGLAQAHVDTLRAIVRDHIKTAEHPTGRALKQALNAEVDRLGVAPR